jgi:phenylacetate-coenzyme A ligase PaaK-like adenylate-forming protein
VYDPPELLLDRLEAFSPDIVTAYPSVLLRLGRILRSDAGRRLRPRFLITNSEVLPTWTKNELELSWRCRVFQFYDCHECNLIA